MRPTCRRRAVAVGMDPVMAGDREGRRMMSRRPAGGSTGIAMAGRARIDMTNRRMMARRTELMGTRLTQTLLTEN